MKLIFTCLAVTLVCIALGYGGKLLLDREYDSPSRTTITVTDDEAEFKLQAKYPTKNSALVAEKLENWASQALIRSGKLSDTLRMQFRDGSSCQASVGKRDLLIVAAKNKNNQAQLEHLKLDYKAIRDFIVAQTKENKKK